MGNGFLDPTFFSEERAGSDRGGGGAAAPKGEKGRATSAANVNTRGAQRLGESVSRCRKVEG